MWTCLIKFDWQSAWANNTSPWFKCCSFLIGDITFFKLNPAPLQTSDRNKQQQQKTLMWIKQNCLCLRRTLLHARKWLKKSLKPFFKNKESCAVRLIILCKWLIYPIPFMCTSKRTTRIIVDVFCFFPNIASIAYLSLIKATDDVFHFSGCKQYVGSKNTIN